MIALALLLLQDPLPEDDGYRGIWYFIKSNDEYRYKYSGGFATYPQQHSPIAIYSKEAGKTFFCYGGTVRGKAELLHMVSCFDHATGRVPRPRVLLNKRTNDAHDNPTLSIDARGHVWVFSNSHGTPRPSYIHRSLKPYSVEAFERVATTNFSYGQPWHLEGGGFLFLHTRYSPGPLRNLFWMTSPDGRTWSEPRPLARAAKGHYQVSNVGPKGVVGTAFDVHPAKGGGDARTNLYYLETRDGGATWATAEGKAAALPLAEVRNEALVRDTEAEGLLVYLKDLNFDADGRPVILYLTSKGFAAGPKNDPRTWHTARWTGRSWEVLPFATSDHNYDFGSLYVEEGGSWRIIGTTEPGPQAFGTGGEVAVWTSRDRGQNWTREKVLTRGSPRNHTYPRRPLHAHPDFYAFWADGDTRQPSESHLYFTNRAGDGVWRLPPAMTEGSALPEKLP